MTNLRIPGPTPLPKQVLKAISQQMINHRGHSYEEIQKRVVANLQYFFQTGNDIFLLTSSGMGGLEAAVANFFSPGDALVFFTCGEFGNRWAEVAGKYGARVKQVKSSPGKPVDKNEVYKILKSIPKAAGVFFTHNETSTGILNNIADLAPLVKTHKAKPLLLVDSVSAMGAVDLPVDNLGIDVIVSASQKAWMAPPGLSMIAVSEAAWNRHKTARNPRYYFDISMYKNFADKNQTPATPAVTTLFGLDAGLKLMKKEGRSGVYKRHLELRDRLRAGIRRIGLDLFVSDIYASPTVTSVVVPSGIDAAEWLKLLREKYNCILAGGMGETKGKVIRIAHMGNVTEKDIDGVLAALKKSLRELK